MAHLRRICVILALVATAAPAQSIDFNHNIRPILSERCFTCHGPDAANRMANLRLDLSNGAHGHESEILRRIASKDDAERMPPPYSGKPRLTSHEINLLGQWIAQGTPWQPFWSFIPPQRPVLPITTNTSWPNNPIN